MSSRSEKEKAKKQNDRHQSILAEMLQETENKFCADCNAKGPRWASWNLGIFLCIRCAGIHRNLGVHISRVKSVNLDSWTPEQIESIQQWGNKRSRDIFEYYLPEDFRRPQGDSAMEAFIRNKYEKKVYLRKDGVPPPKKTTNANREPENKDRQPQQQQPKREKKREKETTKIERPKPSNSVPVSSVSPQPIAATQPAAPEPAKSNMVDLLSLDTPTPSQEPGLVDLFGPAQNGSAAVPTQAPQIDLFAPQSTPVTQTQPQATSQGAQSSQSSNPDDMESALFLEGETKAKSAKDSIMALYQSQSNQNQMYGVPGGMYIPPSQTKMQPQATQQQGGMYLPPSQTKMQPQATQQQGAGYQMYNGGLMGFQPPQMNMPMSFGQQPQQFMSQPQHVQVGQLQQQMHNLNLKHSLSQPSLLSNHPGNQMQFLNSPQQMTNWLSQPQLSGLQQQTQPQFVTTGPVSNMQGYNMFPMGTSPPVGNTLSHQLWK